MKLTSESKFNTKQPQEQIKVYEVKDEEINLKSENGVERMDEADGQEVIFYLILLGLKFSLAE